MIITLKGADFSGAGNNIGNLSQIGGTFTFTINPTPSDATVKINGTARKSITGAYGTAISWEVSKNGNKTRTGSLTMPLGGKTMSVSLTAVGSVTPPVTPEEPTMYTFTINPTPTNATVTLTASGYSQSGKSITVPANTSVAWKVTASGYTEQKGTHTVTKTETKNVTLDATSIENQIDLGTINNNQWIKFENGENQSLNAWKSTADYIAIPDGVTSIHSDDITAFRHGGANTTPYAFYDVDKNYISGVDMETIPEDTTGVSNTGAWRNSLTYDVPENAAYVRICWTNGGYRHMTTGVGVPLTSPIVQWVY